jgi:hypothetical protein
VKGRLNSLLNRRKVDDTDDNRPRLRKGPGGGTTPIEGDDDKDKKSKESDEDERPTLKRRPE